MSRMKTGTKQEAQRAAVPKEVTKATEPTVQHDVISAPTVSIPIIFK